MTKESRSGSNWGPYKGNCFSGVSPISKPQSEAPGVDFTLLFVYDQRDVRKVPGWSHWKHSTNQAPVSVCVVDDRLCPQRKGSTPRDAFVSATRPASVNRSDTLYLIVTYLDQPRFLLERRKWRGGGDLEVPDLSVRENFCFSFSKRVSANHGTGSWSCDRTWSTVDAGLDIRLEPS